LQNDIINSNLLIIIGYSFSDIHINNIISLFKGKCIIVGYIKKWVDAETVKRIDTSSGKMLDYENVFFDIWNDDINSFLKSIEPSNGGFDNINEKEIQSGSIISKNGNTKFWWKGIGDDFYSNCSSLIA
jgi:hypothetical protein